MLKLILGGIALATVGYGVKKFIEDDINISTFFDDKVLILGQKAVEVVDNLEEKSIGFLNDLEAKLDESKKPEIFVDLSDYKKMDLNKI
jgi:hypothetical protein